MGNTDGTSEIVRNQDIGVRLLAAATTFVNCAGPGLRVSEQPWVYNRQMPNIVITGASRGIGFATALELARAGHAVVATMRNPAGSPELREQAAREKLPLRIEPLDVDSDESVKMAFG